MDKTPIKKAKKKFSRVYLIYVVVFAILLFAIQKPRDQDGVKYFPDNDASRRKKSSDRVELIETGKDAGLVRLNLIANAEESIDISYFTFKEGMSTDVILGSILDAADRGVKVRLILDGLDSIVKYFKGDLRGRIYGFDLHPNIEMRYYEPPKLLLPKTWNIRLHDKIIIVDKKIALIGGRNLGDVYFLEDREKENFSKDRDVLIYKNQSIPDTFSVVDDMRGYFNKVWNYENTEISIERLSLPQEARGKAFNEFVKAEYEKIKSDYSQSLKPTDWHENTMAVDSIRFVHNPLGRGNKEPWCLRELLGLSEQAKETIFIQSPYIIPSRSMKAEIRDYDIGYDKTTLLTNSLASSPNIIGIAGYSNNKKAIVDEGVDLYEYQGPDSIHSKTYVFDKDISVIGSFNFDARSSYISTESMVIIKSEEFTSKLKKNIQEDLDNSLKVDKDYSYIENKELNESEIPPHKKMIIKIAAKIVYFIEYLL